MYGILSFAGIDYYTVGLILIIINILGLVGSILTQYEEGKGIFHIGYYMALGILLRNVAGTQPRMTTLSVILMIPICSFAIYSFIVFILRIRVPVERERESMTFLFLQLSIISFLIQFFLQNLFVGLALAQIYLFLLYSVIARVQSYALTNFE